MCRKKGSADDIFMVKKEVNSLANEIEKIVKELESDLTMGLTRETAEKRLEKEGPNRFVEQKSPSFFALVWSQVNNLLIYILLGAALISFIVGEVSDSIIIGLVIAINTIVGVIQEQKAEKALQALKEMSTPIAVVKRDGVVVEIPAENLVRGDIVILEAGRVVPADIRLIESVNLQMEESSLTGESTAVMKEATWKADKEVSLGDQKNMAFNTTLTTYGRGVGIVVRTGMDTEVGKIAGMLEKTEKERTPLQEKLHELGKVLGIGAIVVSGIIFLLGFFQGREVLDMFLIAVSLAVAAIPEGLPAIVTIVLALGVQRMIKRNAVIRNLPAVETLGAVNVVCSDKTGTLTQNKMTVTHSYINDALTELPSLSLGNDTSAQFLRAIILCNDATVEHGEKSGDPTEIALIEAGLSFDLHKKQLEEQFPRVLEVPFDSARKMMTTVHRHGAYYYVCVKGAIDRMVPKLSAIEKNGKTYPFTTEAQGELLQKVDEMAEKALRVLGVAYKKIPATTDLKVEKLEEELIFLGLTGMIDPPREEVKDSIKVCHHAGVNVKMITGDHPTTALAIAKELHIAKEEREVMTGPQLDLISDAELQEKVKRICVFARVSPTHKVRIVEALQKEGNIVSMTGDGVNDAPSLQQADVGVAMGITGTDVAKGAADVVLTDDNFSTITAAIEEGRNIYQNIKKSILFLLSCNFGEIVTLFIGILMGWPAPLTAIHILWVNLITDTLPAIALGVDPEDPDVMQEHPRSKKEHILTKDDASFMLWNGLVIGLLTLFSFMEGLKLYTDATSLFAIDLREVSGEALIHAQTLAFLTLSIAQLFHSSNVRSRKKSIFQSGIFSNRFLIGAIIIGIGLQIALVHVPKLSAWFHLRPLIWEEWLFVIGLSLVPVAVNELVKAMKRIF